MHSETGDRVIFSTTLFLIVFAPLSYGATQPWALNIIRISVLLMLSAWLLQLTSQRNFKFLNLPFIVPACLLLITVIFQLTPLPSSWRDFLSFSSAQLYAMVRTDLHLGQPPGRARWTSLTVDPKATKEGFLNWLTYIGLCFVLLNKFRTREKVRTVVFTLIGLGSFEALYGLIEYWSDHQHIFWYRKVFYTEDVTGTYINHNHFAGLMGLIIPLAVGIFGTEYSRYKANISSSFCDKLRLKPRLAQLRITGLLVSIGLMLVALILSNSRGGLFASMISLTLLACFLKKTKTTDSNLMKMGSVLVLLAGIVLIGFSREITSRFSYALRDAPERIGLWKDSLKIVQDFPLWGTGLGTYRQVIPRYRSKSDFLMVSGIPQPASWDYAHNDYLQLLIECGLIGCFLALWALVATLRKLLSGLGGCRDWENSLIGCSLLSGMIALLIHSFVDFNLHIPANALLFCVLLSLSLIIAKDRQTPQPHPSDSQNV